MTEILENVKFLHDDDADDDRAMIIPRRFIENIQAKSNRLYLIAITHDFHI